MYCQNTSNTRQLYKIEGENSLAVKGEEGMQTKSIRNY